MHPLIKKSLPLIEKSLSMPMAARLLLLVNVGALLSAFVLQFGFDVKPCYLCLWARIPYASVAALSFLALVWKPYGRHTSALLGLCAVVYLAGMGIAIFQTGVEQHWWQSVSGCEGQDFKNLSPEEIRQALLRTEDVPCDIVSWSIFGFSLANMNIPLSFVLAFFAAMAAKRNK
ncbi:MAG: disulfide bond formation protein B [Bdellovibrionales bacterium]